MVLGIWAERNQLKGRCEKLITKVNDRIAITIKNSENGGMKHLKPRGCYCACSKRLNLNFRKGISYIHAFSTLEVQEFCTKYNFTEYNDSEISYRY